MVDANGVFYRTEEQRMNAENPDYENQNLVSGIYSYIPNYEGMLFDGINAVNPSQQPGEYKATLKDIDVEVLEAYQYEKWTDFLQYQEEVGPWFPIYSVKNTWEPSSEAAVACQKIEELKREWLPKVIMSSPDKVDAVWDEYMNI